MRHSAIAVSFILGLRPSVMGPGTSFLNSILPPTADDATADEAVASTKPPAGHANGTAATDVDNTTDSRSENAGAGESKTGEPNSENPDTASGVPDKSEDVA